METPLSLVTQVTGLGEESMQAPVATWTSVGAPLLLVTQLAMVEESI